MTLKAARIAALLDTARYGRSLDVRDETGSTNDDARAAADAGALDGHVVVADRQTRGRGAHGRSWSSPGGSDLYFSVVARPALTPSALPAITLAAGHALATLAARLLPASRVEVKWPNDLLIDGKKCAGVLVESATTGSRLESAIIGIGLDVNRRTFDAELADRATSLALAGARPDLDREAILADLLADLERSVDSLITHGPAPLIRAIEPRLAYRGARVRCADTEGTLTGLAPTGAIRIATPHGEREIISGTLEPLINRGQVY